VNAVAAAQPTSSDRCRALPTNQCDLVHTIGVSHYVFLVRPVFIPASALLPFSMFLKLFRKSAAPRPHIEQDAALAEDLARRVNAIQFRPSKGFLKDQRQPKRSAVRAQRSA
jgi:hypothetical protein